VIIDCFRVDLVQWQITTGSAYQQDREFICKEKDLRHKQEHWSTGG